MGNKPAGFIGIAQLNPNQSNIENSFDQSFWDSQFKGTKYYDLYQAILQKYASGPANTFWTDLTGSSTANSYNHMNAFHEELNALLNKMYDEGYNESQLEEQREYDSPANQSKLMSQAGLNADFLGVGSSGLSPASAESRSSGPNPAQSSSSPLNILGDTLKTVMNIYSTIKGFKGIDLANEASDLNNIQKLMDMARPHIVSNYSSAFEKGTKGSSDWIDIAKMSNPFKGRKADRYIKAFNRELSSGRYSAAEAAYKQLAGVEEGRSAYGVHVGNPNWSADDKALFHYIGGLMEMEIGSRFARNKFDRNYYSKLSPDLKASFENEKFNSEQFLYRLRRKTVAQLENDFNNGSILAGLFLIEGFPQFAGSAINSITSLANPLSKLFGKKK